MTRFITQFLANIPSARRSGHQSLLSVERDAYQRRCREHRFTKDWCWIKLSNYFVNVAYWTKERSNEVHLAQIDSYLPSIATSFFVRCLDGLNSQALATSPYQERELCSHKLLMRCATEAIRQWMQWSNSPIFLFLRSHRSNWLT